jgi:hypothetical protein
MESTVKQMSEKIDLHRGATNERLLREEVRKRYGEDFSKRFVCQGLSGLTRLVIKPKRMSSFYEPRDIDSHNFPSNLSDVQLQEIGMKNLVDMIYKRNVDKEALKHLLIRAKGVERWNASDENIVDNLTIRSLLKDTNNPSEQQKEKDRLAKFKSGLDQLELPSDWKSTGTNNLLVSYLSFCQMSAGNQMKTIKSDCGIGMMLLTLTIPKLDKYFPIVDLEFDCRGDVDWFTESGGEKSGGGDTVIISVGEIKSSLEGVKKAKQQLRKRLLTMQHTFVISNYPKQKQEQQEAKQAEGDEDAALSSPSPPSKTSPRFVLNGTLFFPAEIHQELDYYRCYNCTPI